MWSLLGLLFTGGYVGCRLLSESGANIEYDKCMEEYHANTKKLADMLVDGNLEYSVGNFVRTGHAEIIKKILKVEIDYISRGNQEIIDWFMTNQPLQIDCILSHFGKLSDGTLIYHTTPLGLSSRHYGGVSESELSIRVAQCIESNLRHTTKNKVLFGVNTSSYPCATMVVFGTSTSRMTRPYDSVEIPFLQTPELQHISQNYSLIQCPKCETQSMLHTEATLCPSCGYNIRCDVEQESKKLKDDLNHQLTEIEHCVPVQPKHPYPDKKRAIAVNGTIVLISLLLIAWLCIHVCISGSTGVFIVACLILAPWFLLILPTYLHVVFDNLHHYRRAYQKWIKQKNDLDGYREELKESALAEYDENLRNLHEYGSIEPPVKPYYYVARKR